MARRPAHKDHDPSRREFFKTFSRQTIQNAGAVAGAAAEIRRTGLAAARELLDMNEPITSQAQPVSRVVTPPEMAGAPQETFRSPYRFTGSSVVVLDQRELPSRVLNFECHNANEVAAALRSGAVTAGPVMGQIAAYGVVLAALQAVDRDPDGRDRFIHGAADALKAGRREVNAVQQAVTRMVGRYDELANAGEDASSLARELRAEADALSSEATTACTEIGRRWAQLMAGDRLDVLVHGDSGPLTCGLVGMATSGLRSLTDSGTRVHVWVTDGAPTGEGSRVALELTQLDITHTVIPDSAVGWLVAARRLDAIVLRGDTVTDNGDTVALLGALGIAQLATDAHVPVHVLAPDVSWDRTARDASELTLDLRSAAELGSANRARLNPVFDIVPARVVSAYVSERSVVRPPFKEPR